MAAHRKLRTYQNKKQFQEIANKIHFFEPQQIGQLCPFNLLQEVISYQNLTCIHVLTITQIFQTSATNFFFIFLTYKTRFLRSKTSLLQRHSYQSNTLESTQPVHRPANSVKH